MPKIVPFDKKKFCQIDVKIVVQPNGPPESSVFLNTARLDDTDKIIVFERVRRVKNLVQFTFCCHL